MLINLSWSFWLVLFVWLMCCNAQRWCFLSRINRTCLKKSCHSNYCKTSIFLIFSLCCCIWFQTHFPISNQSNLLTIFCDQTKSSDNAVKPRRIATGNDVYEDMRGTLRRWGCACRTLTCMNLIKPWTTETSDACDALPQQMHTFKRQAYVFTRECQRREWTDWMIQCKCCFNSFIV